MPRLLSVISLIAVCLFVQSFVSCDKDKEDDPEPDPLPEVCTISGIYTGPSNTIAGTTLMTYAFRENNFTVGSVKLSDPYVTFGGYRNTCDSVFMSVKHLTNGSYYLLQGKFSADKKTITGAFKNLDLMNDVGTFTITKQ